MIRSKFLLATAFAISCVASAEAKTIEIGIGHQSMCTDTYTAGIMIKELGLLEKHLPHDGQYKDVQYDVSWSDYSLRRPDHQPDARQQARLRGDGRLSADRQRRQIPGHQQPPQPLRRRHRLQSARLGQRRSSCRCRPNIYSIEDLKGKAVSTPVGSAAWGMLLKAMQDAKIADRRVSS